MRTLTVFFVLLAFLIGCTKKVGQNPSLAYSDMALLDSCMDARHPYYKQKDTLFPGTGGPHGTFKLRFNAIGYNALTSSGRLPVGGKMPEGSMIIKDIYRGKDLVLYALMYKKSGSWLWAEIEPGTNVHYSVNQNPNGCTGCHSQAGNRDLVRSFELY